MAVIASKADGQIDALVIRLMMTRRILECGISRPARLLIPWRSLLGHPRAVLCGHIVDQHPVPVATSLAAGAKKATPVIAAYRGRFAHVLIIDEVAALTIMDLENIN